MHACLIGVRNQCGMAEAVLSCEPKRKTERYRHFHSEEEDACMHVNAGLPFHFEMQRICTHVPLAHACVLVMAWLPFPCDAHVLLLHHQAATGKATATKLDQAFACDVQYPPIPIDGCTCMHACMQRCPAHTAGGTSASMHTQTQSPPLARSYSVIGERDAHTDSASVHVLARAGAIGLYDIDLWIDRMFWKHAGRWRLAALSTACLVCIVSRP